MGKKYDPVDYLDLKKAILDTSNVDKLQTYVQELKEVTNNLPGLVKASNNPTVGIDKQPAARGPKAVFYDPLSLQYALGYKDRRFSLTYDTLRRVAHQVGVIAAIINTRVTQVASFSDPFRISKSLGFRIKHKSPDHLTTEAEQEFIERLEMFVANCGEPGRENPFSRMKRPKFESFLKMIVRDTLQFDQISVESVPRRNGSPFEFWPVDASTIRLASPDRDVGMQFSYHHRNPIASTFQPHRFANMYEGQYYGDWTAMGKPVRYVQVVNGQIENVFTDDEMLFGVRNPRTDLMIQGYGLSEVEQTITTVTSILYAEEFNRRFFINGAHPKGILNFKGDNWSPEMLNAFKAQWTAQIAGVENCVDGSTMIWTESGGLPIVDFLGSSQEKSTKIWDGGNWQDAVVYKTKESKKLCRTVLANGVTVSTSPDHKFFVLNEDGPDWKVQSNLKLGDYVAINTVGFDSLGDVPSYKGQKLTSEMLEVLGWMTGDGYLSSLGKRNCIGLFYHHDKEPAIRVRHLEFLRQFGLSAELRDKIISEEEAEKICEYYNFKTVSKIRISIQLFDADFIRWLLSIGFQPSRLGKVIPSFVYALPVEYRVAFLRGFFSADGNLAGHRYPAITITKDKLREQTKMLLLTLGIRTVRNEGLKKLVIKGRHRSYTKAKFALHVKDKDKFLDTIGFLQEHKQPKEMKKPNELGKTDRLHPLTNMYLTRLIRKVSKSCNNKFSRAENNVLNSIICGDDGCSVKKILRYMERVEMEPPPWVIKYHYEPVVDLIDTGEVVSMFDVSVNSESHAFCGNGVILHNSYRTPVTQSEGIEWIDLQKSNLEMGFEGWLEYLLKILAAVFLIDPSEIGFDTHGGVSQTPLFESSSEWKLKSSRDKGLRPLLKFIAGLINEHIVDRLDDAFTFEFAGLDELTEQEKHELLKEQLGSYMTLNEVRRQLDMNEIPGGVGELPLNPTLLQLLQLQQGREDKKQELEQQAQQQQAQQAQGQAQQQPTQEPQDPAKEQAVRHKEEKHPLEMQLLEQKVAQGGMQPQPGQMPSQEQAQPEMAQEGSQQGQEPLQELSQNMTQPSTPDMQSTQGMTPAQASQPTGRQSGDARKQYAALFGKSVTFDDFVEFMRTKQ